jgi:hypothetical protein
MSSGSEIVGFHNPIMGQRPPDPVQRGLPADFGDTLDSLSSQEVPAPQQYPGSQPGSWLALMALTAAGPARADPADPGLHYANFVVTTRANGVLSFIPYGKALADFGRPGRIYHFHDYTIMVWDKNLLADLGAPRSQ